LSVSKSVKYKNHTIYIYSRFGNIQEKESISGSKSVMGVIGANDVLLWQRADYLPVNEVYTYTYYLNILI